MYNIAIALTSGVVVFALVMLGLDFGAWASILPAILVTIILYIVLVKRTMAQLQAVMAQVNKAVVASKPDRAIQLLKSAMWLDRWQPLVGRQLKGQIGQLLYIQGNLDESMPYLKESWVRDHMSRCMYASGLYRKKKHDQVEAVMEKAASSNKKQAFVWGLYAYFLDKTNRRADAIEKLSQGLEHCEGDENLQANRIALQNGKRMKMKRFGEMWYGFRLEAMPQRQARPKFAAFRR